MNVTLSRAEPGETLYDVFREAMEPHVNAARGEPWDDVRERTQFFGQLSGSAIRDICVDGIPVGFVDVRIRADDLLLHTMVITPAWQSRGVGSRVLGELKAEAVAAQRSLSLSVLIPNVRARRFYERLGFEVVSTSPHHNHMVWSSNFNSSGRE